MTRVTGLMIGALAGLAACATSQPTGSPMPAEGSSDNIAIEQAYKIGVDDQVQVNVWGNPDLSVSVPVRPDGMISMPLIGDVRAGGLPPAEVADSIREKLSYYIRDPNVTVLVTELRSHEYISRIRVTGAVMQPVSIPYRQGITILDAILGAGGANEFASLGKAKLHRKTANGSEVYDIPLDRILNEGDLEANMILMPGDTITVPERRF